MFPLSARCSITILFLFFVFLFYILSSAVKYVLATITVVSIPYIEADQVDIFAHAGSAAQQQVKFNGVRQRKHSLIGKKKSEY